MPNLLCDNFATSKRNRERVEQKQGEEFYLRQDHAISQWQWGKPKPDSIIVGELPQIYRNPLLSETGSPRERGD